MIPSALRGFLPAYWRPPAPVGIGAELRCVGEPVSIVVVEVESALRMYREQLPAGCPPSTSEEITAVRVVYRLVRGNPPTEGDFDSYRARNPRKRPFPEPERECLAHGVSVWNSPEAANEKRKLPGLDDRLICRVQLGPGAGRIERNGAAGHCTWWPLASFRFLPRCRVVDAP